MNEAQRMREFVAGVSRFFFDRVESTMIEVLVDDPWFLVISKPIDLLTQAPEGIPSVQSQLIQQLAPNMPRTPFVGIPHRLDRMTSGVLVVARNQRALRRLCEQFAARKVAKEYVAWVEGEAPAAGHWSDWIRKIPNEPKGEIVDAACEGARHASLRLETLGSVPMAEATKRASLVRIYLETGRMHQIRLQFAARNLPIVGDRLYGGAEVERGGEPLTREPPIALHAYRLQFFHPKSGEAVLATAPLPAHRPWGLPELQAVATDFLGRQA